MATERARQADGWLARVPFYPWLFAAFPVIRLYAENVVDVEIGEVVAPLAFALLATTGAMLLLGLLLRDARRAAIVVSAVLLPVLSFGLLHDALPATLGIGPVALLALCAVGVVLAIVIALRARGQLGSITAALNGLTAVLLAFVVIPAASGIRDTLATHERPTTRIDVGATAAGAQPGRDIYHIVLDRYGSQRSFETGFGIDDGDFMAWLQGQGFQVLDAAHANYSWTSLSLAATLGMTSLDDIVQAAGRDSRNTAPLDDLARDSRAGSFLQELGYTYYHVASWFDQTQVSNIADHAYRPKHVATFGSMLYDLSIAPTLLRESQSGKIDHETRHAAAAQYDFAVLDDIREEPGPKYVFAHILLPHPPYVFLEDGTFDTNGATMASQLAYTNTMLRRFLEPLLALPEDERPIIILQGDEGSYPGRLVSEQLDWDWDEATGDELITKYGILNAWYLPGAEGEAPLAADLTAINTYPELFRRAFGADIPDLPDRIYASDKDRPYALTDITERLRAAEAAAAPTPTPDP